MGSMSCLALNASFEPLTIVPTERAVRLVLDRKAEILEVDEKRVFRSAREQLPCRYCQLVAAGAAFGRWESESHL